MKRMPQSLFVLIFFAGLAAGGFFIFFCASLSASTIQLAAFNGNLASSSGWTLSDCAQGAPAGDNYAILTSSSSAIISPVVDLSSYIGAKIAYRTRTYGGVSSSSAELTISSSIDGGASWTIIATSMPSSSAMQQQTDIDLNASSASILIKFETLSATGSKGAGIDDVVISGIMANQPPQAVAFISSSTAESGQELFFDGRSSTDDGQIVDWYWIFGDGHSIFASTTSHAYSTSGNYVAYLLVTDDEGESATSSPWEISVIEAATTTASTTAYADPNSLVINEIYPTPLSGQSEWIEIYNPATSSVDLAGLLLLNIDGGKFVTTTLSGEIGPESYLALEDFSGSLNNTGDSVVLRTSASIISQTSYGDFSSRPGESWARKSDGNYAVTITPTMGALNILTDKPISNSGGNGGATADKTVRTDIVEATTTEIEIPIDYSGLIAINEIYPNPPDSDSEDEFIELINLSTSTIDLSRFVVADASKNKHSLKASSTATSINVIEPGGLFVIKRSRSNIALNNTGLETVSLFSPDLALIDQVEYLGENIEGASYSRSPEGKWRWVKTATPVEINSDDALYPDEDNESLLGDLSSQVKLVGTIKTTTKKSLAYRAISWEQLAEFSGGDLLRLRGVVSALPGSLGSQFFYLADPAGGKLGLQIYSFKKDFPELSVGDLIEVSGELSDSSAGRRLKTADRTQIKVISTGQSLEALPIASGDLGEDYDGRLVSLQGAVLELKGRYIYLDDDSGEAKIYIGAAIELKEIGAKPGDRLTVSGIVGRTAAGYRLLPRDINDFSVRPGEVKGDFEEVDASANSNSQLYYLLAIIVFLCTLICTLALRLRSNKH